MFKQFTLALVAVAVGATAMPATPAAAQGRYDRYEHRYGDRFAGERYGARGGQYDDRRYEDRGYGDSRRYQKCRREGTAGTIIGAIAGGLLGRSVRGDNTTGTILGGAAGALAGRAIDRSDRPGYCR